MMVYPHKLQAISLRWHYPNQVTGLGMHPTLSLLDTQAPLFFIYIYYTPFCPHCNPYFLYNLIWIWYFFIQ